MQKIFLVAFLNIIFSVFSNGNLAYEPWYTGTIFSYDGRITPKNEFIIQPYLFVNTSYGAYKNNFSLVDVPDLVSVNPFLVLYYGINDFCDAELQLQTVSNFSQSKSSTNFGDTTLLLSFQLIKGNETRPHVRLLILETLPTGKYNKLDPNASQTEISGEGAYVTSLGIATEKIYDWFYCYPVRIRWNFIVDIPSSVSVEGVNFYGGAFNTKGKVKTGTSFYFLLSPEISITQRWVLGLDVIYQKQLKGSFSGNRGNNLDGTLANINIFQQDSFQLAPAVEYSFNSKMGVLGGVWFTVFGRNSDAFVSAVVSAVLSF